MGCNSYQLLFSDHRKGGIPLLFAVTLSPSTLTDSPGKILVDVL